MGFLKKLFGNKADNFYAPMAGKAVPVSEVPDPTFAGGMLGNGYYKGHMVYLGDKPMRGMYGNEFGLIVEMIIDELMVRNKLKEEAPKAVESAENDKKKGRFGKKG